MKTRLFSAALLVLFASGLVAAQQFVIAPRIAAAEGTYAVSGDFDGDGHSDVALLGFHASRRRRC